MNSGPTSTPATDERPTGRHIVALDGLRACAVLQVMLSHFMLETRPPGTASLVASNLLQFVGNGIHLFFVLSGFLITDILLRAKESPNYFRVFYARRTLRIFPLYYGVLIAVFGGLAIYGTRHTLSPDAESTFRGQGWLWTYLANVGVGVAGNKFHFGFVRLSHFWTLAVEEQFYLVWPMIVLLVSRQMLARVCLIACVALIALRCVALNRGPIGLTFYVLSNDGLFVGGWLAAATVTRQPSARIATHCVRVLIAAIPIFLLLTACEFATKAGLVSQRTSAMLRLISPIVQTVQSVMFGAVVLLAVVAAERSLVRRLLEVRALVGIGVISYGIYVYHYLLLPVYVGVGAHLSAAMHNSTLVWIGTFGIASVLAIATAWLSWTLYERPILKLKRFFRYDGATDRRVVVAPLFAGNLHG